MESRELKEKQDKLVKLLNDAADKLNAASKDINNFKLPKDDYEMCLKNLLNRIKTVKKDDFMQKVLKYPPRKRGGFGLSRGFEEVLGNIREPWVSEVLDAVYAIERYFRSM